MRRLTLFALGLLVAAANGWAQLHTVEPARDEADQAVKGFSSNGDPLLNNYMQLALARNPGLGRALAQYRSVLRSNAPRWTPVAQMQFWPSQTSYARRRLGSVSGGVECSYKAQREHRLTASALTRGSAPAIPGLHGNDAWVPAAMAYVTDGAHVSGVVWMYKRLALART